MKNYGKPLQEPVLPDKFCRLGDQSCRHEPFYPCLYLAGDPAAGL